MNRTARRLMTTVGATAGSLALLTGTALAHHCYVGTGSANGPASSNWWSASIAEVAVMFGEVPDSECVDVEAGNAALREAGMPLSIKFFEKQTIGSNAPTRVLTDGTGLEQAGAGSTLMEEAVHVYAPAATVGCTQA